MGYLGGLWEPVKGFKQRVTHDQKSPLQTPRWLRVENELEQSKSAMRRFCGNSTARGPGEVPAANGQCCLLVRFKQMGSLSPKGHVLCKISEQCMKTHSLAPQLNKLLDC